MDIVGRTLIGKYRIERLLGQGGMGSVWRGTHVGTGRPVAVKILDERYLGNEEVAARFGREARAASAVQHEGIVEVLDLDRTEEGLPFLVMELLQGESLGARILRLGRLTERDTLAIAGQLLDALEAAHDHGVVHRDLKPDNVLIVPSQRHGEVVKILDFGISQMVDPSRAKLTITGSVLGTPHYMSPEQAMGDVELDRRVDLYAVGIVLYECLCGVVPFDAPNYNALLRVILDDAPRPMIDHAATITPAVEAVVLGALAKDRTLRPASAGAMRDALANAGRPVHGHGDLPSSLGDGAGLTIPMPRARASNPGPVPATSSGTPRVSAPAPFENDDALTPRLSVDLDSDALSGSTRRRGQPARPAQAPVAEPDVRPSSPRVPEAHRAEHAASEASRVAPRVQPSPPADAPPPDTAATSVAAPRVDREPAAASAWSSRAAAVRSAFSDRWDGLSDGMQRSLSIGGIGLLACLLLVGSLRFFVRPGGPVDGVEPAPSDDAPVPARPSGPTSLPPWVLVDVDGVPPRAMLRLDGLPGATLPLRVRPGISHELRVLAPGFEEAVERFTPLGDMRVQLHLRAAVGTVEQHR